MLRRAYEPDPVAVRRRLDERYPAIVDGIRIYRTYFLTSKAPFVAPGSRPLQMLSPPIIPGLAGRRGRMRSD